MKDKIPDAIYLKKTKGKKGKIVRVPLLKELTGWITYKQDGKIFTMTYKEFKTRGYR